MEAKVMALPRDEMAIRKVYQPLVESGDLKKYTKFEQAKKREEFEKLDRRMGGLADMQNIPGAIFVTDVEADKLAIIEAKKLNVPPLPTSLFIKTR